MKLRKIAAVLAFVLCFGMILGACGSQPSGETETTEAPSTDAVYTVSVTDHFGTPYTTGVIVAFLKDGQQVAMQPVNDQGEASKTLEKGDYTVELVFTGDESAYYYDKEALALTAEQTSGTVYLANALVGEPDSLYVSGGKVDAWVVDAGCTWVSLTAGERNYFLFTPTMAGTYEFSVEDPSATIGYYGAPHFVQETSAAELVEGKFELSIRADMIGQDGTGTTVVVVGVDPGTEAQTMLKIQRTGDPAWSVADEPWHIYEPTVELSKYTLPEGSNIAEFDLTASGYELVLNENDGFYHLNTADGPLVLVRLGEKSAYLDSYKTILEHTGVSKYFFDENDEFIKKENYTDCLLKYIENMDEDNGLYPLTEDLKYIIQMSGDHNGWYDASGKSYLFLDQNGIQVPGINPEISWLFMCCYISG